jgi:hypothetical protein
VVRFPEIIARKGSLLRRSADHFFTYVVATNVSIHTYVSIRQHTSAYVSIRERRRTAEPCDTIALLRIY